MDLEADAIIFGGGCAGLWLLDELARRGARVLLVEAGRLGDGQTSAAQGILHGGLKYSLGGFVSPSAATVRDMPAVWADAIAGRTQPDLSAMRLRRAWCYLWRGPSLGSWAGMLGAVAALAVRPVPLDDERPPPLAGCPGQVYRLDEAVIDPISFLKVMADRNRPLVWKIDAERGLEFELDAAGQNVAAVRLANPATGRTARLAVRHVVLAAGEGNAGLRARLGLPVTAMQRRPLQIALLRGQLPPLNGHSIDVGRTRVTITSDVDAAGRTVWQLGGQVSEDGANMEPASFIEHARRELAAVLPGWRWGSAEWATLRVDRAEGVTSDGARPGDVQIARDGNVLTVWPTKLVFAPRLSQRVTESLAVSGDRGRADWRVRVAEHGWPTPEIALAPWEREQTWTKDA